MTGKLSAQPRSWQQSERLREAIATATPFETYGALRGQRGSSYAGQLSGKALQLWRKDEQDNAIIYAVYSYFTPIAWKRVTDNGQSEEWIYPDTRYSVTTSRHQTHVRVAISQQSSYRVREIES